jgi:hypothetical protein
MPVSGRSRAHLAVATAAVANQFVVSANMKVGLYTLANAGAMPTEGARLVTVTHTTVDGADTLGTIAVAGTDLSGAVITDTITPLAGTIATGTKWFRTVTSVTGAGWVATSTADTIVVGCSARVIVAEGAGVLHSIIVNTTAAGAITSKDSAGTIAIIAASVVEGTFHYWDVAFAGYLEVVLAAASDVTVVFSQ